MRANAQIMHLTSADQGVAEELDVCQRHGPFFPQHVGKLIEHLHADDALACQQLFNSVSTRTVIYPINQHIGVDECSHRTLASSRSKEKSVGQGARSRRIAWSRSSFPGWRTTFTRAGKPSSRGAGCNSNSSPSAIPSV